ncbi:MAG: hypothetical protein RLZ63_1450 [Pseudomonadota bacterium]|jgi:tetratricopeptide (TPR) repeat protein
MLSQKLERLITRHYRLIENDDEIYRWEHMLRQRVVVSLEQAEQTDAHAQALLERLRSLQSQPGTELPQWLDDACQWVQANAGVFTDYPFELLCFMLVRPHSSRQALQWAQEIQAQSLSGDNAFLFTLVLQELLTQAGQLEKAYPVLMSLDLSKVASPSLRHVILLRMARLAWSRDSRYSLTLNLKLQQELESASDAARQPELQTHVHCLRYLAEQYSQLCNDELATHWIDRAVKLARDWKRQAPKCLQARLSLARVLRVKGDILSDIGVPMRSLRAYRESMRIVETLSHELHDAAHMQEQLPDTHDVLGDISLAHMQLDKAFSQYEASHAQARQHQQQDPDNVRWIQERCYSLMKLAQVRKLQIRIDDALDFSKQAIELVELLIQRDPKSLGFHAMAVTSAMLMSDLYAQKYNPQLTQHWIDRTQQFLEAGYRLDTLTARWEMKQLELQLRACTNWQAHGKWLLAEEQLQRTHHLLHAMLAAGRHSVRLISIQANIELMKATLWQARGDLFNARQWFQRSLETAQACLKHAPYSLQWRMALTTVKLKYAAHLNLCGETVQAHELEQLALKDEQKLALNHVQEISLEQHWLSSMTQVLSHDQDMLPSVLKRLEHLGQRINTYAHSGRNIHNPQVLYVTVLGTISSLHQRQSNMDKALALQRQQLDILDRLLASEPQAWPVLRLKVSCLLAMAQTYMAQNQFEQAMPKAIQGLSLLDTSLHSQCEIAEDAQLPGQLLLCVWRCGSKTGQKQVCQSAQKPVIELANWLSNTCTTHPRHLQLLEELQHISAVH